VIRYAAHVLVVAIAVIATSFLCSGIHDRLWSAYQPAFEAIGLGSLPFYAAWIVVCGLFACAYPDHAETPWRLAPWTSTNVLVCGLVIAVALAMYLGPILRALDGDLRFPKPWSTLAGGGIVGPIVEEWLFRGIVWSLVRRAAPGRAGLAVALFGGALMFGLWHLPFDGVTALGAQLALGHAGFGVLMGVLRWRTDSIAVCVVVHVAGNSLFVLTR
jgi:membrane protease YdiL (CAAX protease family)